MQTPPRLGEGWGMVAFFTQKKIENYPHPYSDCRLSFISIPSVFGFLFSISFWPHSFFFETLWRDRPYYGDNAHERYISSL